MPVSYSRGLQVAAPATTLRSFGCQGMRPGVVPPLRSTPGCILDQSKSNARNLVRSHCTPVDSTPTVESNSQDAPAENGASGKSIDLVPTILEYKEGGVQSSFATSTKLALAIPWRRVKKGSFLSLKLEGAIAEQKQARFSTNTSMPALCECLRKATYDPRVSGLFIRINPLAVGWAKVQELMSHIEFFKKSGKPTIAYMQTGGEKEYALAASCAEVYVPPTAQLALRGLSVQGQFLRGVLDKVGVEPQVKRIGKYKSAGDQLLRKDMSEPQREQLSALLDGLYDYFLSHVAKARGKTEEDVAGLLDAGIYDMQKLLEGGWVTGLKYADEVQDDLDERFGNVERKKKKKSKQEGKDSTQDTKTKKKLTYVPYSRYKNVSPSAVGLTGKKVIAVLREQGAIVGGSKAQAGQITAEPLIKKLRSLGEDSSVAGVVLRVDSPGGDALASDLMWREIKKLAKEKPLVATMGDVAASGGYYMSMAAPTVLAHPLTITGSIGVVTGKFNLGELYDRVGFSKTVLSRGKYAELLSDNRGFTEVEEALFNEAADFAYRSFRDKAAESRGMEPEELEQHAQGRVWLGSDALGNGLVDHMGGIDNAVALVKQAAEIPADEQVTLRELSMEKPSLQQALTSGGLSSRKDVLQLLLTDPGFVMGTLGFAVVPLLLQFLPIIPTQARGLEMNGAPQLTLDSLFVQIADGSTGQALRSALFPRALMPDVKLGSSKAADIGASTLDTLDKLP